MQLRTNLHSEGVKHPIARMTRFFYKTCELRKIHSMRRRRWFAAWKDISVRMKRVVSMGGERTVHWPSLHWVDADEADAWETFARDPQSSHKKRRRRREGRTEAAVAQAREVRVAERGKEWLSPCPSCRRVSSVRWHLRKEWRFYCNDCETFFRNRIGSS